MIYNVKLTMLKLVVSSVHVMISKKNGLAFIGERQCINDCLVLSEGLSQLIEDVKEFLPILL
jgi:hypothetical protein